MNQETIHFIAKWIGRITIFGLILFLGSFLSAINLCIAAALVVIVAAANYTEGVLVQ